MMSLNGKLGISSKKHEKIILSTVAFSPYSLKDITGVSALFSVMDEHLDKHCWAVEVATFLNAVESCPFSNKIVVNL